MTIAQPSRLTFVRRVFRFFVLLPSRTLVVSTAFIFLFSMANVVLACTFLIHLRHGPETTLVYRSANKRVQFVQEWVQTRMFFLHTGGYPKWYLWMKAWYERTVCLVNKVVLIALGYYKVKVKGQPLPRKDADVLISNHRGLIDALVFIRVLDRIPIFVSGPAILDIPVISTIALSLDVFLIDPSSKENAVLNLQEILKLTDRQVVMFPEVNGPTHGSHVRTFASGSFKVSSKMQPVALTYQGVGDVNPTWDTDMNLAELFRLVFRLSLRETNHASIDFRKPIIFSQPATNSHAVQIAQLFREDIAKALGVPMYDE